MRKFGACIAGLIVSLGTAQVHAHATAPHARALPSGVLQLDQSVFWDGGTLGGQVQNASMCSESNCPSWPLSIAQGGKRLRVGIDTPERSNTFVVEILDAAGAVLASDSTSNQFNSEALLANPAAGTYTVRVRPQNVQNGSYRMRAKLESVLPEDLPKGEGRVPLLPNLKTVPPLEFGFIAPANPLNGLYPPDTVNPPLDVLGVHPVSCTADEMAPVELGGAAAKKCLRFTSGPINLGPGIYDMRFSLLDDFIAGTAQLQPEEALSRIVAGPMEQAVHYSDGSVEFVPAGTYSFHPVHGHFHDDYVLSFRLYAVTDLGAKSMSQVGIGTKSGFCPADQLWGDWYAFDQGYEVPGGDEAAGNCSSVQGGVLGLSVGWGDVYRWQRPGMYVEFDGQGNGLYVVQTRVDEEDEVLETDETDNVSYALVQVEDDRVELVERGWGESPWDPRKTVFHGAGPAQRDASAAAAPPAEAAKLGGRYGGATGAALLLLLSLGVLTRPRLRRAAPVCLN